MENKLDKSWITQADIKSEKTWDNVYYWGYIQGASDFQEQSLKRIQQELDIFTRGNTQHALVAKICFEGVIQIITNLEANE